MKRNKPHLSKAMENALSKSGVTIQRARLISHLLKYKSITTIEARETLNILAPAPRVFELRHNHGLNIVLEWSIDTTAQGFEHRIGKYILLPGKWKGGRGK